MDQVIRLPKKQVTETSVQQSILNHKDRIAQLVLENNKDYARYHRKKRRLYLSQKGRCCFCNTKMLLDSGSIPHCRIATIEHVIPRSQGGVNGWKNYKLSCQSCNSLRGVIPFDEFKYLRRVKTTRELKEMRLTRFANFKEKEEHSRGKNVSRMLFNELYRYYMKTADSPV